MGGLLGNDDAITDAIDQGAERVVLSTRTADLDELRHAMDAAVARAASGDGAAPATLPSDVDAGSVGAQVTPP